MQRIRLITILVIFILVPLSPANFSLASYEEERDQLFEELEKIKNEQLLYSQDIAAYQNESNAAMLSVDQAKDLIEKNKKEIKSLEEKISELQEEMERKREVRGELIRKLYINNSTKKSILAFISSANLNEFIEKQIYIKKTQEKVLLQIKSINEAEEELEEEKELAILRRGNLFAQIDALENQLVNLQGSIESAESKIRDLEKNRKEVEQQILVLEVPDSPQNITEVINWNTLDFTSKNNITFYGAGTPHGIGMSQYGAKAMAKKGNDYEKILTHFYQGTYLERIDTSNTTVRIKLSASPSGGSIIVRGGRAKIILRGNEKELLDGESVLSQIGMKLVPLSPSTRFEITYKYNRFKIFRGEIEIKNAYSGLLTINNINIESYIKSVISGEMSHSWPLEALKAQAVAARNYAYKNIKPGSLYDLCDTPTCQVYLGASYEFPSTDQAVKETEGRILKYGSEIITAYYFSTSGGWTENNENVWGGTPRPYLRGVPSPGEEESHYHYWQTRTFTKEEIQGYLNSDSDTYIGDLQKIEIQKRGVSGRIMAIKIKGSAGEKLVTGKTFKYVININLPDGTSDYIKSTLFGIK